MLTQQERQMHNEEFDSKTLMNVTDQGSYGRGQTRGRGMRGQPANFGGRSGNGRGQSSKICTYCNKTGHTVDNCYKKHGFPPHMKQYRSTVNNFTSDDIEDEGITDVSSQKGDIQEEQPGVFFTKEQHMKLLALLQ